MGIIPLQCLSGGFAEYALVEAHFLVHSTPKVSDVALAGCMLPMAVWHYTLTYKLHVTQGTTVLFPHGALDGVHLGMQIAALKGLCPHAQVRPTWGTVWGEAEAERLRDSPQLPPPDHVVQGKVVPKMCEGYRDAQYQRIVA